MLTSLFNLFIIICLLYVFYRVVGQSILPNLSRRRLERYKQKFFEKNQHISSEKLAVLLPLSSLWVLVVLLLRVFTSTFRTNNLERFYFTVEL